MTAPAAAGPWPEGAAAALNRWRQGHALDGVPLLGVGAPPPTPPFWAAGKPTTVALAGLPVLAEDPPVLRRTLVVSQGCDIVKASFPFATVVPVYDASAVLSDQQQVAARSGQTWHLVHLTADWAATGMWVADLRIEVGVDKALLASRAPLEAFADETGYARLAERLAAARQRPAVPESCLEHVVKPLREHLADRRAQVRNRSPASARSACSPTTPSPPLLSRCSSSVTCALRNLTLGPKLSTPSTSTPLPMALFWPARSSRLCGR